MITDLYILFKYLPVWDKGSIDGVIRRVADEHGVKYGDVAKMLRVVVFGVESGPSLAGSLEVIGNDVSISRIKSVIR